MHGTLPKTLKNQYYLFKLDASFPILKIAKLIPIFEEYLKSENCCRVAMLPAILKILNLHIISKQ